MDYLINILNFVLIYAIAVQALNFILGSLGIVSICHAIFIGIGAYSSALVAIRLGWGFFPGTAIGFFIAFVVGCLLAAPSLRVQDEYLIVFTVGFQMVMFEFFLTARNITQGQGGIANIPPPKLFGFTFDSPLSFLFFMIGIAAVIFLLSRRIFYSPFGRVLKAIRDNESAARSIGKNSLAFKVLMFGLSGGIAAVSGSCMAHYVSYITPSNFSIDISIYLLVMVILGGTGNFYAPLVGTAVLVGLPEVLRFIPGSSGVIDAVREISYGLILMLIMVFRPQGILPEYSSSRKKMARPRSEISEPGYRAQSRFFFESDKEEFYTGSTPAKPIIEIHDVSKSFGGIKAISNASMNLPPREITGLIGPNGCGKTTLFNVISGYLRPEKGTIYIRNNTISNVPPYRLPDYGIVRSWQDVRIFNEMTALENVLVACPNQTGENLLKLFLMPKRIRREENANRQRALKYLELVGLAEESDVPAKNLSAAEQKLLALARLLATECPVLLLDEPTAALDIDSIKRIKALIKRLVDEGKKTILLVEHNLDVVKELVNKSYFMSNGEILAYQKPAVLMQDQQLTEVYFGTE